MFGEVDAHMMNIYSKILFSWQHHSEAIMFTSQVQYLQAYRSSPMELSITLIARRRISSACWISLLSLSAEPGIDWRLLWKLIGLAGSFLFLSFEFLNCRWDLGQIIVYAGNLLVDSVELLEEEVALGFQPVFGFLQTSLRLV